MNLLACPIRLQELTSSSQREKPAVLSAHSWKLIAENNVAEPESTS